jgi:hypothetical protein
VETAPDRRSKLRADNDLDLFISKLAGAFGQQLEAGFRRLELDQHPSPTPPPIKAPARAPAKAPEEARKDPPYFEPANSPAPVHVTKRGYWYAIINGRDGVNAVFADWVGGASEYVTGVPGATVKKYSDYNDAMERVQQHLQAEKGRTLPLPAPPPPYRGDDEESGLPSFRTRPKTTMSRPSLMLYGSDDPSAKNEDSVFGIDLGSDIDLREKLCPPRASC